MDPLKPEAIDALPEEMSGSVPLPVTQPKQPRRSNRGLVRTLVRNRKAQVGLTIVFLFVVFALLAPIVYPGNPSLIGQYQLGQAPSGQHWLGTTSKGQDVMALTMYGARSSLSVGFVVGVAATLFAVLVGLTGAYFGRFWDETLSVITSVFLLVPSFPLLVVLASFMPPGVGTVMVVLVITGWAGAARVLRSQALSIRSKDYIAASIVTGQRPLKIMFSEMLPNMASIMMATFLSITIGAIGAQAGLEFLGLGDQSVISWGTNLFWAGNDGALMKGNWWEFIPSGLCIALVAFGLALINYGVDEVTNPRLSTARATAERRKNQAGAAPKETGEARKVQTAVRSTGDAA